jgi:hypothetical protein
MLDHRDVYAPDNERLERPGGLATRSCESGRRRLLSRAFAAQGKDPASRGKRTPVSLLMPTNEVIY